MTKRELSQLYWLNREIEKDKRELLRLKAEAEGSSGVLSGMPKGTGTSDRVGRYASEIADLEALIEINIRRCFRERNRLMEYINSIDDSLIRMILSLRYVNGLPWSEVAACVGGGNSDISVQMVIHRFLKRE